MITVYTALEMTKETQNKKVVMEMEADDAFAIATLLFNASDNVSDDWRHTIDKVARELVEKGNNCRVS